MLSSVVEPSSEFSIFLGREGPGSQVKMQILILCAWKLGPTLCISSRMMDGIPRSWRKWLLPSGKDAALPRVPSDLSLEGFSLSLLPWV